MTITASTITANSIILMKDGRTQVVNDEHPNYRAIREAMKTRDYDTVESLMDVAGALTKYAKGKIRIENGKVFYGDHEIKNSVVTRIFAMQAEGFDIGPMIAFLENLMANPSKTAVDELYLFLEATSLPITEDGHFLAYKKVRDDYKDFYTGKFDHAVGTVLEVPRNTVDENRNNTCSHGLHFCSLSYLPHYHGGRGKVMILKINPADVVTIPSDYNNAKGRAFRYTVFGEHTGGEHTETWTAPVYVEPKFDDFVDSEDQEEPVEQIVDNCIAEYTIKNIIKDMLDINKPINLTDEFDFDLGADDLDILEIVMAVEEELNIEINEGSIDSIVTVGNLVELVLKEMNLEVIPTPTPVAPTPVQVAPKRTMSDAQLGALAGANAARSDIAYGRTAPTPPDAAKSQAYKNAFIKTYNKVISG